MRIIIDFLRLIRFFNLLIIAITQLFTAYFLDKTATVYSILNVKMFFLITATVLSAAAGYIINDYMDVKLDLVNKPHRVIIGNTISRRWAMLLHVLLNTMAVVFAYFVNLQVMILVFVSTIVLWLYSQYLKKTYLTGNVLVSVLTSFTVIILYFHKQSIKIEAVVVYGIFAFLTTLFREIIKDTEDMRGDEQFKAQTLPIVKGIRVTKNILIALQLIILINVFAFTMMFNAISQTSAKTGFLFIIYSIFFICVPMIFNLWLIKTADIKADFTRLSLLSKINMLSGILSMVFWKY